MTMTYSLCVLVCSFLAVLPFWGGECSKLHVFPDSKWMGEPASFYRATDGSANLLFLSKESSTSSYSTWGLATSTDLINWKIISRDVFSSAASTSQQAFSYLSGGVYVDNSNMFGYGPGKPVVMAFPTVEKCSSDFKTCSDASLATFVSSDAGKHFAAPPTGKPQLYTADLSKSGVTAIDGNILFLNAHPSNSKELYVDVRKMTANGTQIKVSSSDAVLFENALVSLSQPQLIALGATQAMLVSTSARTSAGGGSGTSYILGNVSIYTDTSTGEEVGSFNIDPTYASKGVAKPKLLDFGPDSTGFTSLYDYGSSNVIIGWMGNHLYDNEIASGTFNGSTTMPRAVSYNADKKILMQNPIGAVSSLICGSGKALKTGQATLGKTQKQTIDLSKLASCADKTKPVAYYLKAKFVGTIDVSHAIIEFIFTNSKTGQYLTVSFDGADGICIDRSHATNGKKMGSLLKSCSTMATVTRTDLLMEIYFTSYSVEVFGQSGEITGTALQFVKSADKLDVKYATTASAMPIKLVNGVVKRMALPTVIDGGSNGSSNISDIKNVLMTLSVIFGFLSLVTSQ